jgi:hypothetical protein
VHLFSLSTVLFIAVFLSFFLSAPLEMFEMFFLRFLSSNDVSSGHCHPLDGIHSPHISDQSGHHCLQRKKDDGEQKNEDQVNCTTATSINNLSKKLTRIFK